MTWEITGQIGSHRRSGVDAHGWLWEIHREHEARRVLVEVTGPARATDRDMLPGDTAEAIRTEGQTEVERVLPLDDPPRIIHCGTAGCRPLSADSLP